MKKIIDWFLEIIYAFFGAIFIILLGFFGVIFIIILYIIILLFNPLSFCLEALVFICYLLLK